MRIKKVYVRNFRKFLQPVTLTDLCDGVCVIAGENEEGKSTIVHAIRAAFHMKYSTSATSSIQPYNSSAMPEVAVDFELNGVTYQIRKSFGKKGTAELRTDSSVFSGSEAEEKLQELCNLGSDRRDSSIWNVLWVEQGTTFGDLKVGESGKRTLQSALEKELGSIVGGSEGQDLLSSIRECYLKWYTPTGKDSKHAEHRQAFELLQSIDQELAAACAQYDELQSMLGELESTRAAINYFEEKKVLEEAQTKMQALLEKREDAVKQRAELQNAMETERAEQAQSQIASAAWKLRSQIGREAETLSAKIASTEKQIDDARARHEAATKQLHDFQQKRDALEAAYEKALADCESAERLEQLRSLHAQIADLQENLDRAKAAQNQCNEIRKVGEQIKLDRGAIDKIRQLERNVLNLEAQLSAVATRVELRPKDGEKRSMLLTEETEIALDSWGTILISPGGQDLAAMKTNLTNAQENLAATLKPIGVETVAEAEDLERKKAQLIVEYQSFNRELQKHAPAGIPVLEEQLAAMRAKYDLAQTASELKEDEQLSIFSVADSADRLATARAARDKAKQECLAVKRSAEQCEQAFREADKQLQLLGAQLSSIKEEYARVSEKLAAERTAASDDALFQSMKEAELRLSAATKSREELQAKLKALGADSLEADITAAEQSLQRLRADLQKLRENQSRLEGSLQTMGRSGIAEEVERLRGKKEQAETQYARASRKARAIKLLHDVLEESERNSKQELTEPLMRRLNPYIGELFSGSKFEFDSANFGIVSLERNAAEPLQSLSLGTREQISVLTRLAFAEVLSETGAPAVVILDDALVYSDEARFARMQEVLKRASEKFQIIVMTCRETDYVNMGVPIIKLRECVGKADSSGIFVPAHLQAQHQLALPD